MATDRREIRYEWLRPDELAAERVAREACRALGKGVMYPTVRADPRDATREFCAKPFDEAVAKIEAMTDKALRAAGI
jgi:hypothetical protein